MYRRWVWILQREAMVRKAVAKVYLVLLTNMYHTLLPSEIFVLGVLPVSYDDE
jgi:hypothetical protein